MTTGGNLSSTSAPMSTSSHPARSPPCPFCMSSDLLLCVYPVSPALPSCPVICVRVLSSAVLLCDLRLRLRQRHCLCLHQPRSLMCSSAPSCSRT
eukprot:3643291-Rhodomonas_salina.1